MKYIGHIFNVSDVDLGISKKHQTKSNSHDVVVVEHDRKRGISKVCTLSSIVHGNAKRGYLYSPYAVSMVEKGKLIPVPVSEIRNDHLSGFDKSRPIFVKDSDLKKSSFCKKTDLDWRYLLLLK